MLFIVMVLLTENFLVESFTDLITKVGNFFTYIVDTIVSILEALQLLYDMLLEFDARIIAMAESNSASEFTGMPVVEAISTFRYLVGDVAFYTIYLIILFGCLFTIYKLVTLLYDAIDALVNQVTGSSCKSLLTSFLGKIFK